MISKKRRQKRAPFFVATQRGPSPLPLSTMSSTPRTNVKPDVISPAAEAPLPRTRSPSPPTPVDNFSLTPSSAGSDLINPSAGPPEILARDEAARPPPATQPTPSTRRSEAQQSPLTVVLSPCRAPAVGPNGTRSTPDQRRSGLVAGATRRGQVPPMNAVAVRPSEVAATALPAAATVTTAAATAATARAVAVPVSNEVAIAPVPPPVAAPTAAAPPVPVQEEEEDEIVPVDAAAAAAVAAGESAGPGSSSPDTQAKDPVQDERRKLILSINADASLSSAEKQAKISSLLMVSADPILDAITESARKRRKSSILSYHDEKAGVLGCQHYPRRCVIKPACCDRWYTCRQCHDDVERHKCDRKKIKEVKCMLCNEEQPVARVCRACGITFARYFCETCRLYDDTRGKHLYHCPKCGMCRVGANNYHCDRCNACVSQGKDKKKHKCVRGALDAHCPCCQGYLYDSTSKVLFTMCGHAMHSTCLERYVTTSYVCPLCHKELGDMTNLYKTYDREIESQEMPLQYANHRVVIKCYQCSSSSDVKFHLTYRHRCGVSTCRSYNTYIERQYVAEPQAAASSSVAAPSSLPVPGPPAGGGDGPSTGGDTEQP